MTKTKKNQIKLTRKNTPNKQRHDKKPINNRTSSFLLIGLAECIFLCSSAHVKWSIVLPSD